jgi:hypothetical protein
MTRAIAYNLLAARTAALEEGLFDLAFWWMLGSRRHLLHGEG